MGERGAGEHVRARPVPGVSAFPVRRARPDNSSCSGPLPGRRDPDTGTRARGRRRRPPAPPSSRSEGTRARFRGAFRSVRHPGAGPATHNGMSDRLHWEALWPVPVPRAPGSVRYGPRPSVRTPPVSAWRVSAGPRTTGTACSRTPKAPPGSGPRARPGTWRRPTSTRTPGPAVPRTAPCRCMPPPSPTWPARPPPGCA